MEHAPSLVNVAPKSSLVCSPLEPEEPSLGRPTHTAQRWPSSTPEAICRSESPSESGTDFSSGDYASASEYHAEPTQSGSPEYDAKGRILLL